MADYDEDNQNSLAKREHIEKNVGAVRAALHGYDPDNDELGLVDVDPLGALVTNTKSFATKITEVGAITYLAKAVPGSAQASAVWQAMKIDETSGTVITWADGNDKFDNVATDLTTLSYS